MQSSFTSVPGDCVESAVNMESKEILCEKRIFMTSFGTRMLKKTPWQVRREDHQQADERNSDVEHRATRKTREIRCEEHQETDENKCHVECGEICIGHEDVFSEVDQRIQGI